jgi:hypothetical protein
MGLGDGVLLAGDGGKLDVGHVKVVVVVVGVLVLAAFAGGLVLHPQIVLVNDLKRWEGSERDGDEMRCDERVENVRPPAP